MDPVPSCSCVWNRSLGSVGRKPKRQFYFSEVPMDALRVEERRKCCTYTVVLWKIHKYSSNRRSLKKELRDFKALLDYVSNCSRCHQSQNKTEAGQRQKGNKWVVLYHWIKLMFNNDLNSWKWNYWCLNYFNSRTPLLRPVVNTSK